MNKGYCYMFLTAICWSLAGVLIRFNGQTGLMISTICSFIAFLFNILFYRRKWILNTTVIFVTICQYIMGITFVYANQLTTVGNAIVLQYTSMIFVLLYQSIDERRFPKRRQIGVVFMVVFGMFLFFFDHISLKGMIGNVLAIISGLFFGLQFYVNSKEQADAYTSTQLSYLISVLGICLVFRDLSTIQTTEWIVMVISGVVQTALGGIFFAKGIILIQAFTANVICMSEILLAPLWAYLFFCETISFMSLVGGVIIIIGILLNITFDYFENKMINLMNKYEESKNYQLNTMIFHTN